LRVVVVVGRSVVERGSGEEDGAERKKRRV
jgi:hypothetical protein